MTKSEFINRLASRYTNLSAADAEESVKLILGAIANGKGSKFGGPVLSMCADSLKDQDEIRSLGRLSSYLRKMFPSSSLVKNYESEYLNQAAPDVIVFLAFLYSYGLYKSALLTILRTKLRSTLMFPIINMFA